MSPPAAPDQVPAVHLVPALQLQLSWHVHLALALEPVLALQLPGQ